MNTSIIVAIVATFVVLFALYVISGALVPFCMVRGHVKEDVLEGYVVAKAGEGCVVRLKDESLCWLAIPEERGKEILVALLNVSEENLPDGEFDPELNCCSLNRAVLDEQGIKAFIVDRVTDDTVVCEIDGELLLVESSGLEPNMLDEDGRLYLSVRKEGLRMLPLCELV